MTVAVSGISGVLQTGESYHLLTEQHRLEKEDQKERRRLMVVRLSNWAAWYGRNNHAEIDRSSGQIRENSISKLMKSAGYRAIADNSVDEDIHNDDVDAALVHESVLLLSDKNNTALLQYRFLDGYTLKQIAEAAGLSLKTIKRRQQSAIDCLIASIGVEHDHF